MAALGLGLAMSKAPPMTLREITTQRHFLKSQKEATNRSRKWMKSLADAVSSPSKLNASLLLPKRGGTE
jgi:hypothetical protein